MSHALETFTVLEKNGVKALNLIRDRAFMPNKQKLLRTWGITDACKMIGRSLQTLRDTEKEGKIPSPDIDSTTGKRVYTLRHINQLRDYFGTRPGKPNGADPAIIAIANFKGGVTKTTTSVNAAQGFALQGYRVLLIDGDSQGSSTQCFGYIPDDEIGENETLLPYLRGEINSLSSVIRNTYWDSLDLIPANLALYNAEFELPARSIKTNQEGKPFHFFSLLKEGIDTIKNNYDIIIIDCPPSMGMISINALNASNALLIPLPPSMLDFSSTVQFLGMLKDVLSRLPDKEFAFIRILITKFERSENTQVLNNIIRQLFADYVMTSVMPLSEAIKKAGTEMLSVYEIEKYAGAKKTLDRIKQCADEVNSEIKDLIHKYWDLYSETKQNEIAARVRHV